MGILGYIARERERERVHMRTINDDERRKTRPPKQKKVSLNSLLGH